MFQIVTSFEPGKITTSIGLASIKVSDYTSKDVIKEADMALYQAKANGKEPSCYLFRKLKT